VHTGTSHAQAAIWLADILSRGLRWEGVCIGNTTITIGVAIIGTGRQTGCFLSVGSCSTILHRRSSMTDSFLSPDQQVVGMGTQRVTQHHPIPFLSMPECRCPSLLITLGCTRQRTLTSLEHHKCRAAKSGDGCPLPPSELQAPPTRARFMELCPSIFPSHSLRPATLQSRDDAQVAQVSPDLGEPWSLTTTSTGHARESRPALARLQPKYPAGSSHLSS
jgi:hypothetical protein